MNVREEIAAEVAKAQRGARIRVGDRLLRGAQVVEVLEAGTARIRWQDVGGQPFTATRGEFLGRSVSRIAQPASRTTSDPLEFLWQVVSSKQYDHDQRVRMVAFGFNLGAFADEERAQIDSWLLALRSGKEPKR